MSRFYGSVQGNRGEATRCGHAGKGLDTAAASWSGAVFVHLYVDDDERDCARVWIGEWQGKGPSPSLLLFDGPFAMVEDLRSEDPLALVVRESIMRHQERA